jgi:hypothetical protein
MKAPKEMIIRWVERLKDKPIEEIAEVLTHIFPESFKAHGEAVRFIHNVLNK